MGNDLKINEIMQTKIIELKIIILIALIKVGLLFFFKLFKFVNKTKSNIMLHSEVIPYKSVSEKLKKNMGEDKGTSGK